MIDLSILQKVPLLTGLSIQHLSTLQPLLKELRVAKGTYILRENTSGDKFYLLTDGCVQVTKDLVKGFEDDTATTEKVLATLCGKDLPTFGENGVLGQGDRIANIIATTDSVLWTLSKSDFERFASHNYEAAYIFMTNIARKISMNLKSTDDNLVKLATALYIVVQH